MELYAGYPEHDYAREAANLIAWFTVEGLLDASKNITNTYFLQCVENYPPSVGYKRGQAIFSRGGWGKNLKASYNQKLTLAKCFGYKV